jgi:hypothetical protein
VSYMGRTRGEHTGCEETEWVSETSVGCKVGQGVQGSSRTVVTVGERSGSVTDCGDIQLSAYLANTTGSVPLVLDLRIAHDRFESRPDPSLNDHLHYPNWEVAW